MLPPSEDRVSDCPVQQSTWHTAGAQETALERVSSGQPGILAPPPSSACLGPESRPDSGQTLELQGVPTKVATKDAGLPQASLARRTPPLLLVWTP